MLHSASVRLAASALASLIAMASAGTDGVYSPDFRWTKDNTVAKTSDPLTITACWKYKPDYQYVDATAPAGSIVAVFDFTKMMDGVETAIRTSWEAYSNIKIVWVRGRSGAGSCDITVDFDPNMNDSRESRDALGYYDGVGTKSPTRTITINPLYFDPVDIHKASDPSVKYSYFRAPGVANQMQAQIQQQASTAAARLDLALKITKATMVHEFGHFLGIYHEQCFPPGSYTGNTAGCDQDGDAYYHLENLGQFDMYSIMLYNGFKDRRNDYTISCGDVMTVRQLYGKKEVPFDSKNICYVGADVCRDKPLPAMPKTSADPIPTSTTGGSCSQPAIDDAVFQGLPTDQQSSTTISTSTTQDVTTTSTVDVFAPNPTPPAFTITNGCPDVHWWAPDQNGTSLQKAFIGDKVHVYVTFTGRKAADYFTLFATQNYYGTTWNPPQFQVMTGKYNNDGPSSFETDFVVPASVLQSASGGTEKSYFLGFQLLEMYTSRGGPLGPISQPLTCLAPKSIWASERIKQTTTTTTKQVVTTTETARFGILNGFSSTVGPSNPTTMAGAIFPLEWAQSKQVAATTFDLQMYPAQSTAKESPSASYRIGTWKKGEGSYAEFITIPRQFTSASGQLVRMKGWVRFKGTANINNASNGTLVVYSLPFYVSPPAPNIETISPLHGNPGDIVTLSGRFDGISSLPSYVAYKGTQVPILTASESQITFAVPQVRTSGAVVVSVDGVESSPVQFQIDPRIESVTPEHPRAGEAMTVTGYGFQFGDAPVTVSFGSQGGALGALSDESFQYTFVPSCLYAPGPLTISLGNASATTTITPVPVLTDVMGDAGVPGQTVRLYGAGFANWSMVYLNGNPICPFDVTMSVITFIIPPGSVSGPIKVVIPASGGQTQTESNSFQFTIGPKPGALSKDYGSQGETITMTGSFGQASSSRSVQIGSVACPIVSSSASSIQFQVPYSGSAVSGMISVTVDGITSVFRPFTILPTITSVSQNYAGQGEEVRLHGYFHGTDISFNSPSASISILGRGLDPGDYIAFSVLNDFSATSIGLEAVRYGGPGTIPFTSFTLYPRPFIANLQPRFGLAADQISIFGSHFTDGGVVPNVMFGNASATVAASAPDRIDVIVPAGSNQQEVTVQRPVGNSVAPSFSVNFTYRPVLTSFQPNVAIRGSLLTINGQNFDPQGDNQIYIGGVLAQAVSATETALVARVDQASSGSGILVLSRGVPSDVVPLRVIPNLVPIMSLLLNP